MAPQREVKAGCYGVHENTTGDTRVSPLRLIDTDLLRSRLRFLVVVLAILTAIFASGAFMAFRTATPHVPALETSGELMLLMDNCSSAEHQLAIDLDKVSTKNATLDIKTLASCDIVGSQSVRWAIVMVGPISRATRAFAGSWDAHQSSELHTAEIRRLEGVSVFSDDALGAELPVMVIAGTNDTDAAGGLFLRVSIESPSVGRRDGASIAISVPSISPDVFLVGEPTFPIASFEEPSNTSETVNLKAADVGKVDFDAGQLNTAERIEFASLPLRNPANLQWQLGKERGVSALVVDTNRRQLEQRLLFWAGILAGVAATLLVWLAEIMLEARGALSREGTGDPK